MDTEELMTEERIDAILDQTGWQFETWDDWDLEWPDWERDLDLLDWEFDTFDGGGGYGQAED